MVVGTLLSHWQSRHLVPMSDVNISMAMNAHSIRVVHGQETASTSSVIIKENRSKRRRKTNSSSSDAANDSSNNDSQMSEDNATENENSNIPSDVEDADVGTNNGGAVQDEIYKEFSDYWNDKWNKTHPIAARNFICQSICPALYGLSIVKTGILLALIGGSNHGCNTGVATCNTFSTGKTDKNVDEINNDHDDMPVQFSLNASSDSSAPSNSQGSASVQIRRREQSHLLLVGDPG